MGLVGPVSEEVDWRGYALERFEGRHGPLTATLLLGVARWAWHIPLFFMERTLQAGEGLLSPFAAGMFVVATILVALFAVALVWRDPHLGRGTRSTAERSSATTYKVRPWAWVRYDPRTSCS